MKEGIPVSREGLPLPPSSRTTAMTDPSSRSENRSGPTANATANATANEGGRSEESSSRLSEDASPLAVGVVTDEVSMDVGEALDVSREWGIDHFELRGAAGGRFPDYRVEEIRRVEEAVHDGATITAVSPGILKGSLADTKRIDHELGDVLPRTLEAARRLDCSHVIVFGLQRAESPGDAARTQVLRYFERAAEAVAAADMTVSIENEPDFWVDTPERSAQLVEAVDHPALGLNWDPANLHWGGRRPTRSDFESIRPHLMNLHVKDYTPDDPDVPWRPLGEGVTPWADLLRWVGADTDLSHVTLETHYTPRIEASRSSLTALRRLLADTGGRRS